MRILIIFLIIGCCQSVARCEENTESPDTTKRSPNIDSRDRSAAVAINYCRAAFHRIKRSRTKTVLLEEQEKILNNLNLNGIADQEVVALYTKVLEEIGSETIAEDEREHLKTQFRRNLGRQALSSSLLLSAQVTSLQFGQAMLTGANSWWDYRGLKQNSDRAVWNIDKDRMMKVNNSSSKFLETFWQMIQKKNIPDEWLLRSSDLDKLDAALAETDPKVRLRLLVRLEKFMICYPPYWYHVGRTQQALGQWDEAAATYDKLANYGAGHFRRDEMLCTALANMAAIQEFTGKKEAVETAAEALCYADTAWQANLVCAKILSRHGRHEEAVDATLRNIDAKLERTQSLATLLSIHQESSDHSRLVKTLSNETFLQQMPISAVLSACASLKPEEVPANVQQHLLSSFYGYASLNFGRDDIVLMADPVWQIESAQIQLQINGRRVAPPRISQSSEKMEIRFANVSQLGGVFVSAPRQLAVSLTIKYPEMQPIALQLNRISGSEVATIWNQGGKTIPGELSRRGFLVSNINFGDSQLALLRTRQPVQPNRAIVTPPPPQFPMSQTVQKTFPKPDVYQPVNQSTVRKVDPVMPKIEIESVTPVPESSETGEAS